MSGPTPPSPLRQFPRSFWVANLMEIFERMGWYGFFAVSSLYLTGRQRDGGLGLSSQDRGVIQGLATFFLYFVPPFFGTLADRFGYRRMFLLSSLMMVPAYLLLHLPKSFAGFFLVYFLVAFGHGMFKPVVVSTVVKTTTPENGTLGFGIFYMMVNIGGFLGPIVAGAVRGWSWDYVFFASAGWIALMGLLCLFFYEEPAHDPTGAGRPIKEVLSGMVAVIGNGRFFVLLMGLLVMLVLGSKWWDFRLVLKASAIWLALHILWDAALYVSGAAHPRKWYRAPLRVGEGRYLLFLFLMSGFWTCFNQIFMTLPEYIRDYVDTSDLVTALSPIADWFTHLAALLGADPSSLSRAVLEEGRIKPEHLINLNSLGIITCQVLVSYLARSLLPLTTIVSGVIITMLSFILYLGGASGKVVVLAVLTFSVGEMLASPKSKEYAGRIAPPDKVGMYMGYFYLCVALGNLFGGLLSGVMYQHFGPKGTNRPDLMWTVFAGMAGMTALALFLYDRPLRKRAT